MRRHLKLIGIFVRATVQAQLEYRSGLIARALAVAVGISTSLLLLWVMFEQVDSVGGWNFHQVLVLIGIVYTVEYVVEIWLYPSLNPISGYVQRGEFDLLLLKPISSQFLVTFRYLQLVEAAGAVVGLGVIGYGMHKLGVVTPLNIALLLLFLAVALAIIYSIYLALSTLAFWFTRIEEVATIIWLHSSAGSFPISAYPPWARVLFTFVIPVAFVTNVPAEAATGRLTWEWGLGSLVFGAATLAGSSWLWRRAIRNYSSASS